MVTLLRVKTEVKNEDPIAVPAVSIPDVKNTPKETEGKRVTVKEQMHSPISYASETDLDEVALEMECYDDAAVSPQKVTTDNQEPIKGKKDGLKKKLTAKRKITDGIKEKKSSPSMSKQRSPLKMKKSITNVKASPLKKTIKPDDHGDVIDNPLPTSEEVQGTPKGDNPKTNGVAKTPESVKTRSGRTIKRSPTLSDENMTSDHMAKRPRREALTSPRGRRLYGFKKFRRSAGSKVSEVKVKKPNKLFAPGRGDITPEIIAPLKIEPLKDIKRYVIRPPPPPPPADYFVMNNGKNHPLCREIWMKIFAHLNPTSLVKSLGCCKTWNRWCMHHTLWKTINLSGKYIYQVHLIGIVKRQPSTLILKSSKLTHKQLAWLLARIPQLKTLSLSSCSWAVVSALGFAVCPLLYSLDISWITMSDEQFRDIIRPPADRHPGMVDISRLHKLKHLSVAGTEISNTSLSEIPNHLISLEKLDISYCPRMTDDGIRQLLLPGNSVTQSLIALDISGCTKITDLTLKYLVKKMIVRIDQYSKYIPSGTCILHTNQEMSQKICQNGIRFYCIEKLSLIIWHPSNKIYGNLQNIDINSTRSVKVFGQDTFRLKVKLRNRGPIERTQIVRTKVELKLLNRVKEKKIYSEEGIDYDEIEGKRTYSVEEKLKSTKYNKEFVKILKGEDFTVKYLQEHGLETPIVFHEKSGLGLRVPSENFKVSDVK
ncbi:F-box and leucine-rich repeat protein 10/11 [Mytilus galloprovincialis]|uniref:F-box and leucine-rich repeat protein 10/11 n=1 Tax=Mytilus galloprovincialis TaxID=29158 RepID=A0A8B6F7D2_MYTGA|nr:F-box and leucine-rich repeat protein 10/11 [Mytilus galloprovincialis]